IGRAPWGERGKISGVAESLKKKLQRPSWPGVFSLGDASRLDTSKTGAAVSNQAPVLVANLLAARRGHFFFQAEDGIRDWSVTGVQTCALPIWRSGSRGALARSRSRACSSGWA